ncbi:hypothetical protein NSK_003205 [Nannochloropsis salina CCMP1776]|uniref:Superoxide dismutase copper/zinc binding domain-containing protein n=1 Tax=Nannochloropsis salina CCMP1776 TaxID=1027361 RepID=A0A4D9DAQ1_9STRA|nr:hypothetical protein NSK_003205 [Nannochloropsis salina CCMP1776]|eukprot:TFJ85698.1 hypothetical protein NSK_003205 [Nannochloropsis salina CCMP1776]
MPLRLVLGATWLGLTAAVNQASPGSDPGLQPKEAVVVFNNGVTGDIHLSQANFKSPLEMKLDLTTLRDSVGPWHIHRLPVQDGCSANSTSGHYNPFNVTATYKTCKDATECEAGDLSTKFGPLIGGDVQRSITDPHLTLFGFNSIMGRSIVIHEKDGTRFACGTIMYKDQALVTAAAEFTEGPYVGKAIFTQPQDSNIADTTIFMDVKIADGTAAPRDPVSFAVYDAPCGSSGAKLLNPGGLPACSHLNTSPFNSCALGDLSGRHGTLAVPATDAQALFITDFLPLSGDQSVIGKSLVIEETGTTPAACANIIKSASSSRKLRSSYH